MSNITARDVPRGFAHFRLNKSAVTWFSVFTLILLAVTYFFLPYVVQAQVNLLAYFELISKTESAAIIGMVSSGASAIELIQTTSFATLGSKSTISGGQGHYGELGALFSASILLIGSYLVSKANLPLRYALRIFSFFIAVPCLGAMLAPEYYNASAAAHMEDVIGSSILFTLITPVLLWITTIMLPGNLVARAGISVIAVLFMGTAAILLPAFHGAILEAGGLTLIPFLSIFLNKLLLSFELVCFYGMSASA